MQPFHLGINGSGSHAARHEQDSLFGKALHILLHQLGGTPQRAHHIVERVSRLQRRHHQRARPHDLEHDRDRPVLPVIVADG